MIQLMMTLVQTEIEPGVPLDGSIGCLYYTETEEGKVRTTNSGFTRSEAVTKVCTASSTFATSVDVSGGLELL